MMTGILNVIKIKSKVKARQINLVSLVHWISITLLLLIIIITLLIIIIR